MRLAGGRARTDAPPPRIVLLAERRLRELALRSLDLQSVEAPAVTEAVRRITARLLQGRQDLPEDLEVLVLDSAQVNAYAFPGDLIVVYAGLIRTLQGPEQLAAVIAHEMGHVVRRDAIKSLGRQIGLSALLSLLLGGESEVLVQRVLADAIHLRFSREVEAAADGFALQMLAAASVDPASLADALERLRQEDRFSPPNVLRYLDSHPLVEERIEAARRASAGGVWRPIADVDWERVRAAL